MQLYFDHDIIAEITGAYASSINGKVERPHQTIKNMVHIQILTRYQENHLYCFCYQ